jgi:hypothetical protein
MNASSFEMGAWTSKYTLAGNFVLRGPLSASTSGSLDLSQGLSFIIRLSFLGMMYSSRFLMEDLFRQCSSHLTFLPAYRLPSHYIVLSACTSVVHFDFIIKQTIGTPHQFTLYRIIVLPCLPSLQLLHLVFTLFAAAS